MDSTSTRRPIGVLTSVAAAATAITLTVGTLAPPAPGLPDLSAPRISTQAVELAALPAPLQSLWDLAIGANPASPLPAGVNPIAPVAEQFVRNLASYGGQLVAGQAAQIPGQITVRVNNVGTFLQSVPTYLADNLAVITSTVVGGAVLGVLFGGVIGGSIGQALFPNAEPGSPGAFVAAVGSLIGAYSGVVVGAVLGLATTPLFWAVNTLKLRNSLAVALASTAPEPPPGDTAVEQGSGTSSATQFAIPETPTAERAADNQPAIRSAVAVALQALPSQPQPASPAAAETEAEPTMGLVEPRPDRTGPTPRFHAWTKHLAASAKARAEKAASETVKPISPATVDKTVSRPSKGSDRLAAATGRTAQTKGDPAGQRRSHQTAAP